MGGGLLPLIMSALIASSGLLGLVLLLLGIRGRLESRAPHCRACGFDLSGLTSPGACPECGADLHLPGAIRRGMRRVRVRPLIAALVLFSFAGVVLSVQAWGQAANFNWHSVTPVWALVRAARSDDASRAPPALQELTSRLRARVLDSTTQDELLEHALAYQLDPSKPWIIQWGDLIEESRRQGRVSNTQWAAYVRAAVPLELRLHGRGPASAPESMERPASLPTELMYSLSLGPIRLGTASASASISAQRAGTAQRTPGALGGRAIISLQGGAHPSILLSEPVARDMKERRERLRMLIALSVTVGSETPEEWNVELEAAAGVAVSGEQAGQNPAPLRNLPTGP